MPALFAPEWWSALAAIVVIDIVLAGDNAIVIGLAARNVPATLRRRVIVWGTAGAIAVRVALTGVVVWLLMVPGFLVLGGLALIWIAWKLTRGDGGAHDVKPATSVRGAIVTIVIADAVMGVDNVLAIGGAAQGSFLLVLIGLAISVPVVVWGSTLVVQWVDRFPAILWGGAAVLGWTAAKMIATEPLVAPWFAAHAAPRTALYVVIVGGVVAVPLWRWLSAPVRAQVAVLVLLVAWLTGFGWLENRMGTEINLLDHWEWDDELVDLLRWVGWIPFAIWLHPRVARR